MEFIIGIFVVLIIVYLCWSNTPQSRGFWGERSIRKIIGKTKEGKCYVINNFMVVVDGKSSQIDHILINENGIFVIETKNYSGRIYGNENQQEWTQVLKYGKVKNKFYNPVKQNATHAYRLAKILPNDAPIMSVVVFINNNVSYIEAKNVVGASNLSKFVNTKRQTQLNDEQMRSFYNCLLENRSDLSAKKHVEAIGKLKANIKANICPRCGGNLVARNGRYGKFFGCEHYPTCKFTKK